MRLNLAGAYQAVGRLDEAIPLFERTLADCNLCTKAAVLDKLNSLPRLQKRKPEVLGAQRPDLS